MAGETVEEMLAALEEALEFSNDCGTDSIDRLKELKKLALIGSEAVLCVEQLRMILELYPETERLYMMIKEYVA